MVKPPVAIAVVEDSAEVRRGLVETLDAQPGWRIVAECANTDDALRLIPGKQPDLILLDIVLEKEDDGIRLIVPLRKAVPKALVVMLTVVEQQSTIVRAIQAGASGYILKQDRINLVAGVQDFLAGGAPLMSPSIARQLWALGGKHPTGTTHKDFGLSPRESEVLKIAARGKRHPEIARLLHISVDTVKIHFRHIYEKLNVHSVVEVMAILQDKPGLLDDGFLTFSVDDLKDAAAFAAKLHDPPDSLCAWLRQRLTDATRKGLTEWTATRGSVPMWLRRALIEDLNALLKSPHRHGNGREDTGSIWDTRRFAHVRLREETETLRRLDPRGLDLIRLNRKLIEDAFQKEFRRSETE